MYMKYFIGQTYDKMKIEDKLFSSYDDFYYSHNKQNMKLIQCRIAYDSRFTEYNNYSIASNMQGSIDKIPNNSLKIL